MNLKKKKLLDALISWEYFWQFFICKETEWDRRIGFLKMSGSHNLFSQLF